MILRLADGQSQRSVARELRCGINTVGLWAWRFQSEGLGRLYARHAGRALPEDTPALEARILEATRQSPPDGSTHWSTRKLADKLGVSHMRVARVWSKAGLQPHRTRSYMASDDPEFASLGTTRG